MLDTQNITALRLHRQYLINPANLNEYDELFRGMSPVPTVYWTRPGDPPSIVFRADFDDLAYNQRRRAMREIVKGRFQNGTIAYVEQNELELFTALYQKPMNAFNPIQTQLMDLLACEGPMNIQLMKEMTGLLVKEITPALHRLQQAFIVFEDQADNEWDRAWYLFDSEFSDVDLKRYDKNETLKNVLLRFAKLNVVFDIEMARSFYKLPVKDIKTAIDELLIEDTFVTYEDGVMLKADHELLQGQNFETPKSVYVLHRNDYRVRANEKTLKEKFTHPEFDILYYILVDGEFRGAVIGKFKNGPFILGDIVLDLPEQETILRKNEIIEAVYRVNNREDSPLQKYNGEFIG